MTCENQIGVRNILLTFTECNTGRVVRNVKHELSTADLPTIRKSEWMNEVLTGGYVRRTHGNASMLLNVIRNTRIDLGWYQGDASISIQIEYLNGLVYTAYDGTVIGEERSDTHDVPLELNFKTINETRPAGDIDAAAA